MTIASTDFSWNGIKTFTTDLVTDTDFQETVSENFGQLYWSLTGNMLYVSDAIFPSSNAAQSTDYEGAAASYAPRMPIAVFSDSTAAQWAFHSPYTASDLTGIAIIVGGTTPTFTETPDFYFSVAAISDGDDFSAKSFGTEKYWTVSMPVFDTDRVWKNIVTITDWDGLQVGDLCIIQLRRADSDVTGYGGDVHLYNLWIY